MKIVCKLNNGILEPYSKSDIDKLSSLESAVYVVEINKHDIRTLQQNKALHLWCEHIANKLNDAGMYMAEFLKLEVEWSKDKVKEVVIKPLIKQMFGKSSTTQLSKQQLQEVIDVVTLAFANRGIEIPQFPHVDDKK
jgi:hypothetical protein